jgi:hypothetical protein
MLRLGANLRPATAATGVGGEEVARDAGEPAGWFLSDGGEEVQQVQESLHPNREQVIDGFPITMRTFPTSLGDLIITNSVTYTFSATAVPEPGTSTLLLIGAAPLIYFGAKRRRR